MKGTNQMFIVKLILVPLWPFFIANYTMKKYNNGEFSIKGYVSTVFFLYALMGFGVWELLNMFSGNKKSDADTSTREPAPSAEVAK